MQLLMALQNIKQIAPDGLARSIFGVLFRVRRRRFWRGIGFTRRTPHISGWSCLWRKGFLWPCHRRPHRGEFRRRGHGGLCWRRRRIHRRLLWRLRRLAVGGWFGRIAVRRVALDAAAPKAQQACAQRSRSGLILAHASAPQRRDRPTLILRWQAPGRPPSDLGRCNGQGMRLAARRSSQV